MGYSLVAKKYPNKSSFGATKLNKKVLNQRKRLLGAGDFQNRKE